MSYDVLKKVLVFDIETVSTHADFEALPERMQTLWSHKASQFHRKESTELTPVIISRYYKEKAAIFAEFGKVVCISVGAYSVEGDKLTDVRVKSFASKEEADVIRDFFTLMDAHFYDPLVHQLSGHNIREFDIPYLCRRATILGIPLPKLFQIRGKKPWQIDYFYDTLEMWKFGDYKNYTSLNLLAQLFDIPSPKDDIDGSMVGEVFWVEDDLDRIVTYCEKDVVTSSKLLMKMLLIPYEEEGFVVSRARG